MKRSNGSVLLARTGATQDEIATAIGVSRAAVGYWISGAKKPGPSKREALFARYKIAVDAWDEEARAVRAKPATASVKATVKALEAATAEVQAAATPGSSLGGVLSKVARLTSMADNLLGRVEEDPTAFPLEVARVINSVAATYSLIAKLNGDFDLGSRIFQLPVWRQIERALAAGLAGHPEAAASVARELRRLDPEPKP